MSGRYAQKTSVSSDRSRAEIESVLRRYKADSFAYGWTPHGAMVAFRCYERHVKFVLPLPDPQSREFTHTPTRKQRRTPDQQEKEYEQAVRQRWRALALCIKAKLEAVESGIADFESEFLAHVLLPDGRTVGETVLPKVAEAYATGQVPSLLPALQPSLDAGIQGVEDAEVIE